MSLVCFQNPNQKPVILRKRRQRIKIEANWELFYYRYNMPPHDRAMLTSLSSYCPNLFFCVVKIPARPCAVQPHLELEDEGGAAGRSGGGDARLQRGP